MKIVKNWLSQTLKRRRKMAGINVTKVSIENDQEVKTKVYLDYSKHSKNKDLLVLFGAVYISSVIERTLRDIDFTKETPIEIIKESVSVLCGDIVLDMYEKMEKNKQAVNIYDDEILNIYNGFISKGEGE
jgi:hypothetical protein